MKKSIYLSLIIVLYIFVFGLAMPIVFNSGDYALIFLSVFVSISIILYTIKKLLK